MTHDVSDSQRCEGNEMLPGHMQREHNGSLTLCPLPACEVHGGCVAELLLLTHVCASTQATCLLCLFTWSLPLIIINKYDDAHRNKKSCPSPNACIVLISVTYFTETDTETNNTHY